MLCTRSKTFHPPRTSGRIPLPFANFGHVLPMLADVVVMLLELAVHQLFQVCKRNLGARDTLQHILDEMEPVETVQHGHVERRCCRSLLIVAPHMDIWMVRASVCQPVYRRRIAVIGEDDRFACRADVVELIVREPMRMT